MTTLTPSQAAARLNVSTRAIYRSLRRPHVLAAIKKAGGGKTPGTASGGVAGGFSGVFLIPDAPEVLDALKPARRGRKKQAKKDGEK